MLKKCASRIYMVLIFAFLYLPIIVLIALSFNDSRSKVKWGGFTLRWYTGCFQDEKIMTAFVTTLQVTFLSAIISTLIGTLAALGIAAMKKRHQTIYLGATNIPLLNADIVTGISQMCDRFIKHPLEVVSVGDIVEVKVLSVDVKKQRIQLTMKI